MKIFIIPHTFPSEINPNAGIFIHAQCSALKSRGHEVIVLDASPMNYLHWTKRAMYSYQEHMSEGFVVLSKHVRGFASSRLPRLATFQYHMAIKKLFKRAVRNYGYPDVIYAHFSFLSGYSSIKFGKKNRIPVVVMEHYSLYLEKKTYPFINKITKKTIEDSSAFLAVSKHLADNLSSKCKTDRPITIVPNMVKGIFSYTPPPVQNPFVFISVGNLNKLKGMDILVQEFIKTFKPNDNIILKIIGIGSLLPSLKEQVKFENRGNQIQFLGNRTPLQVSDELKKSHCFVLLSKVETFGIAYREAMITGRPILSWENLGIKLNWQSSYGIIVNSIDEIGAALVYMKSYYEQFDFKQISDEASVIYSEGKVMSSINQLLLEVVDRKKPNNLVDDHNSPNQ